LESGDIEKSETRSKQILTTLDKIVETWYNDYIGDNMTTKEDIRGWLQSGISKGSKYMTVFCDTYDYSDYPVYFKDEKEFREKMGSEQYSMKQMQRVMEIYDLSMDIEKQLNEARANHPPCGY
jgi:hypothetical protein